MDMCNLKKLVQMILFTKQNYIHKWENKYMAPRKDGRWDELGDWDCHIYVIDTMYKIDN